MVYNKEIQEIFEDLKVIDKMYEIIRFVDPMRKKVLDYHSNLATYLDTKCFDFWEKNKVCDNCISIRAYNENQSFVKVEYSSKKIYMITAVPVELNDRKIVIELLKDTTNSMIYGYSDLETSGISTMIDNLNNIALRDDLTNLYNRRYINEKLPIDLINAALSKQSLSVLMVDIDYFKKVNDTYGHLAGDCVLKHVSEVLSESIKRESDWVARFGGEEFLICLPGAGLERAVEIAGKMRTAIENKQITCGTHDLHITVSIGVCCIKPSDGDTIEKLIECADRKLYEAKKKGRNRVEG